MLSTQVHLSLFWVSSLITVQLALVGSSFAYSHNGDHDLSLTSKVRKVLIPKDCDPGFVLTEYHDRTADCEVVVQGKNWTVFLYDEKTLTKVNKTTKITPFHLIYSSKELECNGDEDHITLFSSTNISQDCGIDQSLSKSEEPLFIFLTDGTLRWKSPRCSCGKCNSWRRLPLNFRIDGVSYSKEKEVGAFYSGRESCQSLTFCRSEKAFQDAREQASRLRINKLIIGLLVVTTFFYFLTTLAYGLLWEGQNLPGRTLFSVTASRCFSYTFLCLAYIGGVYRWDIFAPALCKAVGILSYFFLIASYSWVLLLNFDLWLTFRSIKASSSTRNLNKKYLQYVSFGLGSPALISGISIIIDEVSKGKDNINYNIVPDYGNGLCYIVKCASPVYNLAVPVLFLLPGLVFAVLTFITLWQFHKDTTLVRSNRQDDKSSFQLYSKLFVVMSLSWSFQLIIWAIENAYTDDDSDDLSTLATVFLILTWIDVVGTSIAFFVIFACKKNTVAQLRQKYPKFNAVVQSFKELKQLVECASCRSDASELTATTALPQGASYGSESSTTLNHAH